MKYIMFTRRYKESPDQRIPIIFPDSLCHDQVAEAIYPLVMTLSSEVEVTSAGDIDLGVCDVSGSSETLKLDADPEDARIINGYDYFHGIEI